MTLDQKALGRLVEIFPGRRPAPKDYAWWGGREEDRNSMLSRGRAR